MHIKNQDQIDTPLLRITLQKRLSLLIFIIAGFFGVLNLVYLQLYTLGIIEIMVTALSLYTYRQAVTGKHKTWHQYILISLVTTIILLGPFRGNIQAGSVYWCLVLPVLYYMMFGPRQGLFYSLIILVPVLYILYTQTTSEHFLDYRAAINYTLSHFCIWYMCHMYENQRVAYSKKLHTMAMQDALTQVKNRHALDIAFDSIDKLNIKTHMLLIDIDHFKGINDKFGHDMGDKILVEVAHCLPMYAIQDNIFRLGGEEFIILLTDTTDQEAVRTAENLCRLIERSVFNQNDLHLKLSISIGVARFLPGQSLSDFIRTADTNLYSAKKQGRNQISHNLF